MKPIFFFTIILGLLLSCHSKISYLDVDFPEMVPKIYAEGIINIDGRYQQNLTMSPDGREHLFTVTDSVLWRYENILRVKAVQNEILVDTPQFVTDFIFGNERFIGEPMIGPDNKNLFFIADYPPNLWRSKRDDNGDWSRPIQMEAISTNKDDWYPTLSKDHTLYFTNGTVYESKNDGKGYPSKVRVAGAFNERDTRDPCISPNGDYMIFTADSLGYGKSDLYVSFKNENGSWSKAQNLGPEINTEHREFAPYISPDEKFLFFSRRDQWQNAEFSNIYWVSLKVINTYRVQ